MQNPTTCKVTSHTQTTSVILRWFESDKKNSTNTGSDSDHKGPIYAFSRCMRDHPMTMSETLIGPLHHCQMSPASPTPLPGCSEGRQGHAALPACTHTASHLGWPLAAAPAVGAHSNTVTKVCKWSSSAAWRARMQLHAVAENACSRNMRVACELHKGKSWACREVLQLILVHARVCLELQPISHAIPYCHATACRSCQTGTDLVGVVRSICS